MLLAIETSCLVSSVALLHEGVLKAEVTLQELAPQTDSDN